jgi:hypothetical protein
LFSILEGFAVPFSFVFLALTTQLLITNYCSFDIFEKKLIAFLKTSKRPMPYRLRN